MAIQKLHPQTECGQVSDYVKSILDDEEETNLIETEVDLYIDGNNFTNGTLLSTTRRLIWISNTDFSGYSVPYTSISLHAECREGFEKPCIYCQLNDDDSHGDTGGVIGSIISVEGVLNQDEEFSDENVFSSDDLPAIPEMRIMPKNSARLDALFRLMSEMASLNPCKEVFEEMIAGSDEEPQDADELEGDLGDENSGFFVAEMDDILEEAEE